MEALLFIFVVFGLYKATENESKFTRIIVICGGVLFVILVFALVFGVHSNNLN